MKRKILILFIFILCCLQAQAFFNKQQEHKSGYKKNEIISLNKFLYAEDAPENWKHLSINQKGDVIYKGRVIVDEHGNTINNKSSSYLYIKIYIIASGGTPKKGCDETDHYKNGIYGLGCYIYESE